MSGIARCIVVAICFTVCTGWGAPWTRADVPSIDEITPIVITPFPNIDLNLFSVRALEHVYQAWPGSGDTSSSAMQQAVDQKLALQRLSDTAQQNHLDANVVGLLNDALRLSKDYDDYLVSIGAINQQALDRAQSEQSDLTDQGVKHWAKDSEGYVGTDGAGKKIVGDAVGTIIAGAFINVFQQSQRDADKAAALAAAQARFDRDRSDTVNSAALASRQIAVAQKWADGEAGFDDRSLEERHQHRPRDPFAHLEWAQADGKDETADQFLADAQECLDAARLIPAGAAFDDYRAQCVIAASERAERAADAAWFADSQHAYGGQIATTAARICRTRLDFDLDASGSGAFLYSKALNFAGLHAQALDVANGAAKKEIGRNLSFAYDYACLLSLNGQTQLSLDWLTWALKNGSTEADWCRSDPELANMRAGLSDAFNDLLTAKWSWKIDYGIFNDDVILINTSGFTLKSVAFTPTFTKNGQVFTTTLYVDQLAPGESHTFSSVFSIPGSSIDDSKTALDFKYR